MVINIYKTKELVFLRPRPGRWCLLVSFEGIEQVQSKFHSNFSFVDRADNAVKLYMYSTCNFIKAIGQGLPAYCFSKPIIQEFLNQSKRYGFIISLIKIQPLLDSAMKNLFRKMQSPDHVLHTLFPLDL